MLGSFDVIEWGNLHVTEQRDHLQVVKNPIHFVEAQSSLLVQFVDVDLFGVHEKEAESHDFDQHMLFCRRQISFVFKHLESHNQ